MCKVDCTELFKNISEKWSVEAKQESDELFFYTDEVKKIINGNKYYIIGRKGMGKTAIAEYLYKQNTHDVFTERLSFKNFPFRYLYELINDKYTAPNQYITIWKCMIYNSICKMMARNNALDSKLLDKLRKLYPVESMEQLDMLVEKWTTSSFNINLFGIGGGVTKTANRKESSWIEQVNVLENVIGENIDESKYYVLIDELDEDYQNFDNAEEKKTYIFLLTSLFKAVQDVKARLQRVGKALRPVVFLRSDIYNLIRDADKNKWRDFQINLCWKPEELYKMLCHRIYASGCKELGLAEDEVWEAIFKQKNVDHIGNRGRHSMSNFDYITRSTHWRPRDYIHFMRECCRQSLDEGDKQISYNTVKRVDSEFSEYLKGEIIDEIYPVLPNIEDVFELISQIRKQTFTPDEFLKAYSARFDESKESGKGVLLQLFDHGVIGNQPKIKRKYIFKYQYANGTFNHNENVVVHRGLYKALQIF